MSDVFISYSRKDIAFARLLQESLKQSQVDTWIDWERIPVGEKWWKEICEAIENANVFMFIISNNSIGSSVCKDEINQALKNNKRIIPIIVDDLKPEVIKEFAPELPQFNWIIFERDHIFHIEENPANRSEKLEDRQVALPAPPHFGEALEKLNKAIHTDWEWVKFHTKLQLRALEWEKSKDASRLLRGKELHEAEQWLAQIGTSKDPQPTVLQRQFVLASRRAEGQRQTITLTASLVALVVMIVLGILVFRAQQATQSEANARATAEYNAIDAAHTSATAQTMAEAQRKVAVEQSAIALSRQLAAQAINQIQDKNIGLGLLLSMEAYQHADTMDARSSLLHLILTEPQLRYFIYGHTGRIWSVAISPDGKTIASASEDTSIGLWDLTSGNPVHAALMGHTQGVMAVAYSPDGRSLVSGGMDGQIILWNINQGYSSKTLFSKSNSWVYKLAFSPDGKYLAASFTDKSVVIWNMLDQNIACPSLNGQSGSEEFTVLAFSPDGKILAIGNDNQDDGKLSFWNPDTCQQQGKTLDTGQLAKLSGLGQNGEVTSLAYSPDGKQLTIGEADYLLVLDTSTYEPLREAIPIHTNYRIESIAYRPDGSLLALGMDDNTVVLLDPATGKLIEQPLFGQGGAVRSVAFSPDGQTLISGGWDASVLVWGLENQPLSRILPAQATEVAFSPNGKVLASAFGSKAQISLWNTNSWQGLGLPLTGSQGEVYALAFSPDSIELAAGGADKLVHLWNISQGTPTDTPLNGQGDVIDCLAFRPDGKWLAAGGADNLWTIWKMADHSLYQHGQISLPISNDPYSLDLSKFIQSVGFSPDSATFYLSMGGGYTYLINMADFEAVNDLSRSLKWTQGSSTNDILAKMSPNGKTIALANAMDIRLYDSASLQMVGLPMYGHTDRVTGLAFTPDGKLLASKGQDNTIRLWDTVTSQPVGLPFPGNSPGSSSLSISPDGNSIASTTVDSRVIIWDISIQDWQTLACRLVRRNLSGPEWQQFFPDEPYHLTCPDEPASVSGIAQISALAHARVNDGKSDEAISILQTALEWILPLNDDTTNNSLCWFGSLDGFAAEVMPACERAVALAPESRLAGMRDSRGLALALTGKTDEAIPDFQALVDWCKQNGCYDTDGSQREQWIADLKSGKNPFNEQVLQSLLTQQ